MKLKTSCSIFAAAIVVSSATPTLADSPPQEVKDMASMVDLIRHKNLSANTVSAFLLAVGLTLLLTSARPERAP